jgi:rod shape-determining protein MreD
VARHPRSRIGREPSPVQLQAVPIATTMLGSLLPLLPMIATAPVLPPLGFLFLLAWRMLHRNLWPVWMALPLGFFDDLLSGNPLGSSMMLWTIAFLLLEILDRRMMWRDFRQEWAIAAVLIMAFISAQLGIAHLLGGATPLAVMIPQMILSILAFPLVARACVAIDQWRLT